MTSEAPPRAKPKLSDMELILKEYENHDEYGAWGEWTYGKEHGKFGRNMARGMWADRDGDWGTGLQTYENDVTESFKQSIKRWRDLNRSLKRRYKRMEAE